MTKCVRAYEPARTKVKTQKLHGRQLTVASPAKRGGNYQSIKHLV